MLTFDISIHLDISLKMIISFGNKNTEKIWNGIFVKVLPKEIQQVGRRKLRMLNNSQSLTDIMTPPSNMLEKLKGPFKNKYSIRINKQWRICFSWDNGNVGEVTIEDYH